MSTVRLDRSNLEEQTVRKLGSILLAMAVGTGLMTGCTGLDNQVENQEDKLQVYTSIYPLYDFATKVGGDKVNVVNLVPAGIEPHDYEPSARNIAQLEGADVFVYNGAGMESWVDKVLATLENTDLLVVEAVENTHLIEGHSHIHEEEHRVIRWQMLLQAQDCF